MDKRAIIILCALVLGAFFAGRFSAPEKIKTEIQKQVVQVEVEKKSTDKSGDSINVTTSIVKPDGTKITRTRIEHKTQSLTTSENKQVDKETVKETKEITNRRGVVVSALVGIGLSSITSGLVYGVSVQKEVLGPINAGAFGFNDGRIGISLGLEF